MIRPILILFLSALSLAAAEIRVSAAASLTQAMEKIASLYEAAHGDTLLLNFAGSNVLARQIEAGAPADVFFSADEANMAALLEKKLVDASTITPLLSNSLVVIAPSDSALKIDSAAGLAATSIRRIALGDPAAVPAGVYARQWLESKGQWQAVAPKVVALANVRAALAAVESGNVEAGIVYKTDAAISSKVNVLFEVPSAEAPAIRYPVALCREAKQPEAGSRFLAFLKSPEALAVFRDHGFGAETTPASE